MIEPVAIETWDEYLYCTNRGHQPLLGGIFQMPIKFRIEVQREIFGIARAGKRNKVPIANELFYRWVWEHKQADAYPHFCEETAKPLYDYRAEFISHILTKGAHPDMAFDPRNVNILSFEQHERWENRDRWNMNIWPANQRIIQKLKTEYKVNFIKS